MTFVYPFNKLGTFKADYAYAMTIAEVVIIICIYSLFGYRYFTTQRAYDFVYGKGEFKEILQVE